MTERTQRTGIALTVAQLELLAADLIERAITARGSHPLGPIALRADWEECSDDGAVCECSARWRVTLPPTAR